VLPPIGVLECSGFESYSRKLTAFQPSLHPLGEQVVTARKPQKRIGSSVVHKATVPDAVVKIGAQNFAHWVFYETVLI